MFCVDRDGTVIDTDKSVWQQGRMAWMLATLYNTVEPRPEWLALAKHGIDFLRTYGFDSDGRMFFHLTREGKPVRKRRYFFSETFMIAALAAYAKATGDQQSHDEAVDLYKRITRYVTTPGLLPPKFNTDVRPMKGLAVPMILIITGQILREATTDPICDEWIDRCIDEIERDFMKPEFQAVLETVGPNGEFIDHFDGRTMNPGHAIEAAWFILDEAKRRNRRPAPPADRPYHPGLDVGDRLGQGVRRPALLPGREGAAGAGVLAGHEVLVAPQRGRHRYAAGLSTDGRRKVRPLASAGARLDLRPFPRPRIRRVVRLSPPGWAHLRAAQRQSLEGLLPRATHDVEELAVVGGNEGGAMMTSALLAYLQGLAANNNKAWFEAHRAEYTALRQEFAALVGEIIARVALVDPAVEHLQPADCMFRINRDVRFARDKSPYKTQFSASFCPQGRNTNLPSYYFHIDAAGELLAGGGMYAPATAQLSAVRRFIQAQPNRLDELLADPAFAAMGGITGDSLKRPPAGIPATAPHMATLLRKQYLAGSSVDVRTVESDALGDWVVARFTVMAPFIQWLRDALGPPAGEKPPFDIF